MNFIPLFGYTFFERSQVLLSLLLFFKNTIILTYDSVLSMYVKNADLPHPFFVAGNHCQP